MSCFFMMKKNVKIKFFALHFTLLISMTSMTHADTPSHLSKLETTLYSHALSLYSIGSFEKSYPLFEQAFANPQEPTERRLRSSLILAYAPNSALQLKKRHDYALYYLKHSTSIPEKTRSSLYRLIGDAYFDQQNFEKASEYYTLLTQEKDPLSQAYGEYRLGWISLNKQQADLAFLRWAKFIKSSGENLLKYDQDLYQSIVRDLGRSWAEGVETLFAQNQPKDLTSFLPQTPGMKKYSSEFIDGIVLGLKRYAREDLINEFKNQLEHTPYPSLVLQSLLKKGALFKSFPCNIVHWIPHLPSTSIVDQPDLFLILNSCAKSIVEKKTCEKPESLAFQTFFNDIELTDQQRLPRISLSVSCKNWDSACRDFLELALENAQTKNIRLADDVLQPLVNSCLNTFEAPPSTEAQAALQAQLRLKYTSLLSSYAEKRLFIPQEARAQDILLTPIAPLLQDAQFKSSFIDTLKSPLGKETYGSTHAPDLLMTQLSDSEKQAHAEVLLQGYRKEQPSIAWMNLFKAIFQAELHQKNLSRALQLLHQFFPMSAEVAQNEESSGFWEFYWLELQPEERSEQSTPVETWLQILPLKSLKSERALRTVAIALQFEKLPFLWKNWNTLKPFLKTKPEWMKAFFYQSLDQLKANALSSELLSETNEGKTLVQISQEDPSLSQKEVRAVLGDQAQILTDLQSLDQMKTLSLRIQSKKLKLNGTLPRLLKGLLTDLQTQRSLVFSTEWSSEKASKKAKETFVSDSEISIQKLEELKQSTLSYAELSDLTEQLHGFIEKIKEQIQEITSPTSPTEEGTPS